MCDFCESFRRARTANTEPVAISITARYGYGWGHTADIFSPLLFCPACGEKLPALQPAELEEVRNRIEVDIFRSRPNA